MIPSRPIRTPITPQNTERCIHTSQQCSRTLHRRGAYFANHNHESQHHVIINNTTTTTTPRACAPLPLRPARLRFRPPVLKRTAPLVGPTERARGLALRNPGPTLAPAAAATSNISSRAPSPVAWLLLPYGLRVPEADLSGLGERLPRLRSFLWLRFWSALFYSWPSSAESSSWSHPVPSPPSSYGCPTRHAGRLFNKG